MNFLNALKGIVRWAVINSISLDNKDFPVHKVAYMGKAADALAWYPYGFHANPGAEALCVMLSMNADPENKVILPGSPKERGGSLLPTPLLPGEVLVYNPTTQSYIHMKLDGGIDIEATISDINIKSSLGNVNVDAINSVLTTTGITRIVSTGLIDIDSGGSISIDSPSLIAVKGGVIKIDGTALVDLIATLVEASNGGTATSLCNEAFLAMFNLHTHQTISDGPTAVPHQTAVVGTETTTVLKGE
jgi:hypothetical protein